MDFDKAKKQLIEGAKQATHGAKTGIISADLAWKTLGSPVPMPQHPDVAQTRDPGIAGQIDNPSSLQSQNENYADYRELIEEDRRRQAFEDGIRLRDPDEREERPRTRGR